MHYLPERFLVSLSLHGRFLWTSVFFFSQCKAINVLQLRDPSTESESGKAAYLQSRSQNCLDRSSLQLFLFMFMHLKHLSLPLLQSPLGHYYMRDAALIPIR
jgi:hypothetical protein